MNSTSDVKNNENNKFDCYYDEKIKVNLSKYPIGLLEIYNNVQKAYENKNTIEFLAYRDSLEETAKACCQCGILSVSDLDDIRRKLGFNYG